MRILLITGDAPRHRYFFHILNQLGYDVLWWIQARAKLANNLDIGLDSGTKRLLKIHQSDWIETEEWFFQDSIGYSSKKHRVIDNDFLQGSVGLPEIQKFMPDAILSYGCRKLGDAILSIPNVEKLNVHGGLSPWYRGTITNFWPTYLLEPLFTGMTFHRTTSHIDGGGIVFQTNVTLELEDGVNQTSCRATKIFFDSLSKILSAQAESLITNKGVSQSTTGRIWTNSMWKPQHLSVVYGLFENRVNKYCYENGMLSNYPRLINALDSKGIL